MQESFDPAAGLFLQTEENSLYPSPTAVLVDPEALDVLRFLGTMVGKALYEGILVELPFAGAYPTWND
jgi:ubiquitin-protein ligase E3 C